MVSKQVKPFMRSLLQWVSDNDPDWEKEPFVLEWMNKLPSDRTRRNARYGFVYFIGFVKQTPTQILEQRLNDISSSNPKERGRYEDLVVSYKNELSKQDYSENMIITMINRVQSFFSAHRVNLRFSKSDLKINLSDEAKGKRRTKIRLNHDQIRAMYKLAEDIETRVAFMLAVQNGLLPADIVGLKINQLPLTDDESGFDYVELYREKTDIAIQTFISPELKHDIRIMLKLRPSKEGYLFETKYGTKIKESNLSEKVKELGPLVDAPDFAMKDLRDYFHSSLENESIPEYHKKSLMGHIKEGSEPSYLGGLEGLRDSYMKVFHKRLSVNGWVQSRKDLAKHEDRLKMLFAALAAENPKESLINLLEEEWGYPQNTIWNEITGKMIADERGNIRAMNFEDRYKIIVSFLREK